jgi:hypothetical protein
VHLLPFFWYTYQSGKQLTTKSTFIKGKTLLDQKLTFWTMTLWNSDVDMKAYRNTDSHKKAMPKLQHWCDEASIVHWQQQTDEFPTWVEAHQRMEVEGRLSKVRNPSADHLAFKIPAPRVSATKQQILFPKK